jgi:hypothetical protein
MRIVTRKTRARLEGYNSAAVARAAAPGGRMIFEFTEDDIPSPERRAALQDEIDSVRQYAGGSPKARDRELLDSLEQFLQKHDFLTRGRLDPLESLRSSCIG